MVFTVPRRAKYAAGRKAHAQRRFPEAIIDDMRESLSREIKHNSSLIKDLASKSDGKRYSEEGRHAEAASSFLACDSFTEAKAALVRSGLDIKDAAKQVAEHCASRTLWVFAAMFYKEAGMDKEAGDILSSRLGQALSAALCYHRAGEWKLAIEQYSEVARRAKSKGNRAMEMEMEERIRKIK
jgi:hypothetical protein